MKKLFIAFFFLLGSAGILNAQTPQKVKKSEVKTTEVKANSTELSSPTVVKVKK